VQELKVKNEKLKVGDYLNGQNDYGEEILVDFLMIIYAV
jgi:hypothetical protein